MGSRHAKPVKDKPTQAKSDEFKYFMMEMLPIRRIDPAKMSRARSVVDSVNELVYNQLKTGSSQFTMRTTDPLVLQGSVADGTKVRKPDEFDYLIPMDLCSDHWEIVECRPNPVYGIIRHDIKRRNNDGEDQESRPQKTEASDETYNAENISEGVNETKSTHCRAVHGNLLLEHRVSASKIYEECFRSIYELDNSVNVSNVGERFKIKVNNHVFLFEGPAIRVNVYCNKRGLDERESFIKIDYVPALCVGGRYFVCMHYYKLLPHTEVSIAKHSYEQYKTDDAVVVQNVNHYKSNSDNPNPYRTGTSMFLQQDNWRESFSYEELRLMREIEEQSPTLFEIYRSFKALLADLVYWRFNKKKDEYKDGPFREVSKYVYEKRIDARLYDYSRKCKLAKLLLECPLENVRKMLPVRTFRLKSVLFYLWKRKELRGADEETLAREFVASVNDSDLQYNDFKDYFS